MLVSDVVRIKGHHVVRIHPADSVELAVHKLAEHRIGALVVEDRWMKPAGIFSERDFIVSRDGAAVLGFHVQQLISTRPAADPRTTLFDALAATTVGGPTTDLAIQAEQWSGSVDPLFSDTGRRWSDTG